MEIGSDLWNARVYAGLSVASELAAMLDRPRLVAFSLLSSWQIYWRFGRLNRDLDEIIKECDRHVPFPPEIPGEMIRVGRDILLKLYTDCKRLQPLPDGISLRGLINKRITRLHIQSERIIDVADWYDAISSPDETNAKFDAALEELAKGDVVSWAAVQ
jgi:hypothetical protein